MYRYLVFLASFAFVGLIHVARAPVITFWTNLLDFIRFFLCAKPSLRYSYRFEAINCKKKGKEKKRSEWTPIQL